MHKCIIIRDDISFLLSQGAVLHGKCGDLPAGCGPPGNLSLSCIHSYLQLLKVVSQYPHSCILVCTACLEYVVVFILEKGQN